MDKPSSLHRSRWSRIILWLVISLSVVGLILAGIAIGLDLMQPKVRVWLGDEILHARLADTESRHRQGLSGVRHLGDDQAMLFVFDRSDKWGIWMKGMKIPIDIIWLDDNKRVVHIERNVQPDAEPYITYLPDEPARYVIETSAGTAERVRLGVGDVVKFSLEGQL